MLLSDATLAVCPIKDVYRYTTNKFNFDYYLSNNAEHKNIIPVLGDRLKHYYLAINCCSTGRIDTISDRKTRDLYEENNFS